MSKKILAVLMAALLAVCTVGCSPKESPSDVVKSALESYRALEYESFKDKLTEEVPKLNQRDSNKTEPVKKAISNISYNITDSKTSRDSATVTLEITALFVPNVVNKYLSAFLNAQMNGDIEPDDKEKADELFNQIVESPDADRMTETMTLELRKVNNKWKIVPSAQFVSALIGFQDREATKAPEAIG